MPTGCPLTAISTAPQKQWPVCVLLSTFITRSFRSLCVASSRRGVFLVELVVVMNDRASAIVDRASGIEPLDANVPADMIGVRSSRRLGDDPLSDVLKAVRLTGAVFCDAVGRAPRGGEQPPRKLMLPRILPGADHLVAYHVVTEGRCFANVGGEAPIAVDAGEIVVFTRGDPHSVSSSHGMRAR